MRQSHKSHLRNILIENAHNSKIYPANKVVADGGALLHQISWNKIVLIVKSLVNIVITYKIITVYVL